MGFEACQRARGKRQLVSCRCRKRKLPGVPSFTAILLECGEGAFFEPWQPWGFEACRRARGKKTASFLPVQKATLGTTGSCPSSVLHCHGRCFRTLAAVDFEACRRARGKGQLVLVGAESDVRHYRPLPGGPFRPSLPFCLSVARALFSSLGSRGFRGLPAGKRKRGKSFF